MALRTAVMSVLTLALTVTALPMRVDAQGGRQTARAASAVARTPWGHPDIQGLYNNAWLTPLERSAKVDTEHLTAEEATSLEQAAAARRERLGQPSDPNRTAPPVGGDGSPGAAGNVGGYNYFWIDNGEQYFSINGQRRSSIIVDPPDGRVPPLKADARTRQANQANAVVRPTSDAPENVATQARGAYDDPELRPLAERCLIGFGSVAGPPMLPVLYNNFKQIVQTPDYVMILVEMVHDVRIIPLNKPHAPPYIRKWLGDSVGRWEGDTLVVETTNFTGRTRFRGSSEHLTVTERFTPIDGRSLLYRFTVDDPSTWDRPWSGEYPFMKADPDDHLYEYACHEANYSFGDIMRGARLLEREGVSNK